jgi:hypothetical protein
LSVRFNQLGNRDFESSEVVGCRSCAGNERPPSYATIVPGVAGIRQAVIRAARARTPTLRVGGPPQDNPENCLAASNRD